ncbi:unnamed protein product, partial [Prorocentrum cordatum]
PGAPLATPDCEGAAAPGSQRPDSSSAAVLARGAQRGASQLGARRCWTPRRRWPRRAVAGPGPPPRAPAGRRSQPRPRRPRRGRTGTPGPRDLAGASASTSRRWHPGSWPPGAPTRVRCAPARRSGALDGLGGRRRRRVAGSAGAARAVRPVRARPPPALHQLPADERAAQPAGAGGAAAPPRRVEPGLAEGGRRCAGRRGRGVGRAGGRREGSVFSPEVMKEKFNAVDQMIDEITRGLKLEGVSRKADPDEERAQRQKEERQRQKLELAERAEGRNPQRNVTQKIEHRRDHKVKLHGIPLTSVSVVGPAGAKQVAVVDVGTLRSKVKQPSGASVRTLLELQRLRERGARRSSGARGSWSPAGAAAAAAPPAEAAPAAAAGAEVKYLWLDWPCMWQANKDEMRGQREITVDEKAEFDLMLSEVNMLYLGCRVVILLDMTYLSRFWTLYEAWLSQMKPTSTGLKPALISDASRCDVVPIMGANDAFRSALLSTIANQMPSASLAAKYLRNDDISVTNASDKEKQLDRVSGLDYRVIQVEIDAQAEAGSTVQMQRVLAAGFCHSLGLLKDGTVTACGLDSDGQRSGVARTGAGVQFWSALLRGVRGRASPARAWKRWRPRARRRTSHTNIDLWRCARISWIPASRIAPHRRCIGNAARCGA